MPRIEQVAEIYFVEEMNHMLIAPKAPAILTRDQRAKNAAQSLHSAELEGHSVTPETQADTELYVSGEIDSQELLRRVKARYDVA